MNWDRLAAVVHKPLNRIYGKPVTYRPIDEDEQTGIFGRYQEPFVTQDMGVDVGVEATRPSLDLKLSDLDIPPKIGFEVEVSGRVFEVASVQPDGNGYVKLSLLERTP